MEDSKSSYRSIFKATSLFGGVQVYQILIQFLNEYNQEFTKAKGKMASRTKKIFKDTFSIHLHYWVDTLER